MADAKGPTAKLPPITWLRAFDSAARHGSFAAASDELALTPAAVSQQIRLLEQYLGVQLFFRQPRGVTLTDIGRAYAQPVDRSFSDLRTATAGLFGESTKSTVRVRASISYATLVLAPRLAAFRNDHPNIDVQLSTTVWADRLDDVGVDVDIRYGTGDWDDGSVRPLGDQYAGIVCHPAYAASFGDGLTIETVYNSPTIHIIGSEVEWSRLASHLERQLETPRSWMKADSSLVALQMLLGGTGFAIVMEALSRPYVERGLLVDPFGHRLPIAQSFFMVLAERAEKRTDVTTFCRWLSGTQ
ncbi:MAG: LysR substrate-binding domain-containing protein [Alphaproteobacteria bacterium]|nr:LysR substrate-binding domain-containing protein [Alphaproteobacteria bacterium]